MRFTKEILCNERFKRLDKLNIPRIFRESKPEDFRIIGTTKGERDHNKKELSKFMDYYNKLNSNIEKGRGLVLTGPCGVGKTLLLSLVVMKAIELCDKWNEVFREVQVEKGSEYVETLEREYRHNCYFIQGTTLGQLMFTQNLNEQELKIRRAAKKFTVFAVDDITKMLETKMGNEISFIDDIFRHRNFMQLTTLISSQTAIEDLSTKLSEPLYDLIHGNSLVLTFVGPSQREKS